ERVTGRTTADPARLEVQLVMTDRALLQGENEPARLTGYGIVPAQYARDLIRLRQDPPQTTQPGTGDRPPDSGPPGMSPPGTSTGRSGSGFGRKAPPAGTEP